VLDTANSLLYNGGMKTNEQEWCEGSIAELNKMFDGKTIFNIDYENAWENYVNIIFTDGSFLRIRYDYIYGWSTE
jgi:hypothetical protein